MDGQTKQFECNLDYFKIGDKVRAATESTEFEMSEVCYKCRQYFLITGRIENGVYKGMKEGSALAPDGTDKRNTKFLADNLDTLNKKYAGKFIVIHGGRVVAFGEDITRLRKYVLGVYPGADKTWLIERMRM